MKKPWCKTDKMFWKGVCFMHLQSCCIRMHSFFHAELLDVGAQSRGGTRGFISKSLNFVLAKSLRERQLLLTLSSLMWSQCGGRTVDGSHFTDKKLFFCTEPFSWSLKS